MERPEVLGVAVYRSQVFDLDGFSRPSDVGGELLRLFGPFVEYGGHAGTPPEIVVEVAGIIAKWLARASLHLALERGSTSETRRGEVLD